MLGAGIYHFPNELLIKYRNAVVDKKMGPGLRKMLEEIADHGYIIGQKYYKRVPRGYGASHENAEFLLFRGLSAMIESGIPEELYSRDIVNYAFSHFTKMYPLHEWLIKALG